MPQVLPLGFFISHFPPLASPHAFLVLMQLQWSPHAGPGGLKVGAPLVPMDGFTIVISERYTPENERMSPEK